jgi:hypothetical protein
MKVTIKSMRQRLAKMQRDTEIVQEYFSQSLLVNEKTDADFAALDDAIDTFENLDLSLSLLERNELLV